MKYKVGDKVRIREDLACVNTERKFIGFELDSHFYEIAQERIMTTKK